MEYKYNYALLGQLMELTGKLSVSEKGTLKNKNIEDIMNASLPRIIESTLNQRNLLCVDPVMIRDIMCIIALDDDTITGDGWYMTKQSSHHCLFIEKRGTQVCFMIGAEGVFRYIKKGDEVTFPCPVTLRMRNNIFNYLHHRCLIDLKRIQTNAWIIKGCELDVFREICEMYQLKTEEYIPFEFL